MTEAEATLIAGLELIADYEYQRERIADDGELVPLSVYLEDNLYAATQAVLNRNNGK